MENVISLLDALQIEVGCEYLSDMRPEGKSNRTAREKIKQFYESGYSRNQWDKAFSYLYGGELTVLMDEHLCQRLSFPLLKNSHTVVKT